MLTIALTQRKGGTGKTTTAFSIAGALAADGRRVLLIDLDPQASLTTAIRGVGAPQLLTNQTSAALFSDGLPNPSLLVHPTELPGISLVPGGDQLATHNLPLDRVEDKQLFRTVKEFLSELQDHDCIVIDTPPTIGLLTWSAAAAADIALSPLPLDLFALTEVTAVSRMVDGIRKHLNNRLAWSVFANMTNKRAALQKTILEQVRSLHGHLVLAAEVPAAAAYPESVVAGKPLPMSKPKGKEAKAIIALTMEVIQRTIVTDNLTQEVA